MRPARSGLQLADTDVDQYGARDFIIGPYPHWGVLSHFLVRNRTLNTTIPGFTMRREQRRGARKGGTGQVRAGHCDNALFSEIPRMTFADCAARLILERR